MAEHLNYHGLTRGNGLSEEMLAYAVVALKSPEDYKLLVEQEAARIVTAHDEPIGELTVEELLSMIKAKVGGNLEQYHVLSAFQFAQMALKAAEKELCWSRKQVISDLEDMLKKPATDTPNSPFFSVLLSGEKRTIFLN